MEYKKVI